MASAWAPALKGIPMKKLTTNAGPQPRTVDAGRGVSWWGDAWTLFLRNPGMWVVMGVLLMVLLAVLMFIPVLGPLVLLLLTPVLSGSWLLAARKVQRGGDLEVGELFAIFKDKERLTPLLVLGAVLLAAMVLAGLLVGALSMGAGMGAMIGMGHTPGSVGAVAAALSAGFLAMLIFFVLLVTVGLAAWFAPALVVFHGVTPIDALKASLSASMKNVIAMTLYGLLYLIAAMLASLPMGLGWVVLFPLVMLSMYVSYIDIFGSTPPSAGSDQLVAH
jgi:hypothetical protein